VACAGRGGIRIPCSTPYSIVFPSRPTFPISLLTPVWTVDCFRPWLYFLLPCSPCSLFSHTSYGVYCSAFPSLRLTLRLALLAISTAAAHRTRQPLTPHPHVSLPHLSPLPHTRRNRHTAVSSAEVIRLIPFVLTTRNRTLETSADPPLPVYHHHPIPSQHKLQCYIHIAPDYEDTSPQTLPEVWPPCKQNHHGAHTSCSVLLSLISPHHKSTPCYCPSQALTLLLVFYRQR
jgi:hypothetical protein